MLKRRGVSRGGTSGKSMINNNTVKTQKSNCIKFSYVIIRGSKCTIQINTALGCYLAPPGEGYPLYLDISRDSPGSCSWLISKTVAAMPGVP